MEWGGGGRFGVEWYVLCAGTGWCLGIYKTTNVEGVKTCR